MKRLMLVAGFCFCLSAMGQQLTHGPITGGVTDTSARIFVRLDAAVPFDLEVATDPAFSSGLLIFNGTANAAADSTAIVGLNGLLPDTRYYVRVRISGNLSGPVASFETFDAPQTAGRQVFVTGSCHYDVESADSSLYLRMAADQPKAFINCGDWGYPDADSGTINIYLNSPPTSFAARMENHRNFYKKRYSCPGYRSFLQQFPVDYVYDDHDFLNDNCGKDAVSGFDLNLLTAPAYPKVYTQPPVARLNTIQAYQEWFPAYPLVDPSEGVYHRFRSGNAEFFVLDLRAMRTPQAAAIKKVGNQWVYQPPVGYTLLGNNQMSWLLQGLQNSTATWKFIISSDAFNIALRMTYDTCLKIGNGGVDYWAPEVAGFSLPNYGYTAVQNYADCWAGFKEEADSLVRFVTGNNIPNVFMISGDTHTAGLDDGTNSGIPELNCGVLKKANSQEWVLNQQFMGFNIWNKGGSGLCAQDNFEAAYGRIETFGNDSVRLSAVDANGNEVTGWTFLANEPYRYNRNHYINRLPRAANDLINTPQNVPVNISVTSNDSDPENDPLFAGIVANPNHGILSGGTGNVFTYTPTSGFLGTDTFTYQLCDRSNASCYNCVNAQVLVQVGNTAVRALNDAAIQVFPNPVEDRLEIRGIPENQLLRLDLYSISGPLMKSTSGQLSLDMKDLPAGMYQLHLITTGKPVIRLIEKK